MEESTARADPGNRLATPEAVDITGQDDREHPALLRKNFGAVAEVRSDGCDAPAQRLFVNDLRHRIISILDQHFGIAERKLIDESIAVELFDGRIHDNRSGNAMWRKETVDAPDEFLSGEIEATYDADATGIDHGIGLQWLDARTLEVAVPAGVELKDQRKTGFYSGHELAYRYRALRTDEPAFSGCRPVAQ